MVVGFDFGTTNSLVSAIAGDRAVNCLDANGLPIPSVVRYDGPDVIVGRDARTALDTAGIGIFGSTVRSPKFLLGEESVFVGGVERSPVDIVADVVRHVRVEALRSRQAQLLDGLHRAVVSIPVTMDGRRRAALRDAFTRSDVGIAQFVHEPLAALYGFVRGAKDPDGVARALDRRNVLVVDWGGGTLDLTLCHVRDRRVVQMRNGGASDIGGDAFDEAIRNEVIARAMLAGGIDPGISIGSDASARLLHMSELNKIELSVRDVVTFYRPGFFGDADLNLRMARSELETVTRPLVNAGLDRIEALLDSVSIAPSQVALCLAVGGMASMPLIRSRLNEIFGPQRVVVPKNSGTLVAEGAAWIAHDGTRLNLAKPIELALARGSFQEIVRARTPMPGEHEVKSQRVDLYCADPSDGTAKVAICSPTRIVASPSASEPRTTLKNLTVAVDQHARLFAERITLEASIDDDLVLNVEVVSSEARDRDNGAVFDLEFGIELPRAESASGDAGVDDVDPVGFEEGAETHGAVVVRANVASQPDKSAVPGEVLYKYDRHAFDRRSNMRGRATEEQVLEHLYYQPCAVCGRSWSDPSCRCASGRGRA